MCMSLMILIGWEKKPLEQKKNSYFCERKNKIVINSISLSPIKII